MATKTLYPDTDGNLNMMTPSSGTDHYAMVDETSADDDTTYLKKLGAEAGSDTEDLQFTITTIQSGDTINHVTVHYRFKQTDNSGTPCKATIYDNNTTTRDSTSDTARSCAANSTYENFSYQFSNNPDGTSWTYTNLTNLEFGVIVGPPTKNKNTYVTQIYIVVDYTAAGSNHPVPDTLKCDGATTQTNAFETPFFTAVLKHTDGAGNYLTFAHIDISTVTNFASFVAQSGWVELSGSGCLHNAVCENFHYNRGGTVVETEVFSGSGLDDGTSGGSFTGIDPQDTSLFEVEIDGTGTPDTFKWRKDGGSYTTGVSITGSAQTLSDGVTINFAATTGHASGDKWSITVGTWTTATDLKSNTTYYYRIKCKSDDSTESTWATYSSFSGLERPWLDQDYPFRRKLTFNTDHPSVPEDYTANFSFKTGNRQIVATDGCYNEGIAAGPGSMIADYGSSTFIVYLSEAQSSDGFYYIKIVEIANGIPQTPVSIYSTATIFDTHNYPVLCIDNSGYLHIFWGYGSVHPTPLWYLRSENSADTSSWINPANSTGTPAIISASNMTYPCPIYEPTEDEVFIFYRYGTSSTSYRLQYQRTINQGESWENARLFIYDNHTNRHKVYLNGIEYDKFEQRLHLTFTYVHYYEGVNQASMGVWYAYSDYDDTETGSVDVGFNIWYWADDVEAGWTAEFGAAHAMIGYRNNGAGWTTEKAKAIFYSGDDAITNNFSINLAFLRHTDGTGRPIVFWYHIVNRGNGAAFEVDFSSALWNGNSWTITRITQDKNILHRAGRNGLAVMMDKDALLHCYFPMGGKTYWRQIATSDVDDTNCTPSTGIDNYAMVDDGIALCDDDTYVTVGASTGKMSFDHSGTINSDYNILGVEIAVVAAKLSAPSGDTSLKCYISDGTTDDVGSSQTVDSLYFTEFLEEWHGDNPFTSTAWTVSDINSLEFGVQCDDSTDDLVVIRVILKVLFTEVNDEEWFTSEVYEIISDDGGVTWGSLIQHSQNSHLGIPIMNQKHDLGSNNAVEICWISGNDIFYMNDQKYGGVLTSGNDLKLYYGDTEIDRVLDYPNLNETIIRFAVQGTIAADDNATDHDYYLYYGNPNETSQPLADPNNVFLFFESWEDFDKDDNISGVGGWTVNSGTGTIYKSPPEHSNKMFTGEKSLEWSGAGNCQHQIGSGGVTNVYAEVIYWQEDAGSLIYLGFEDSGADQCRIGEGDETSVRYAAYYDSTAWVYTSDSDWHNYKKTYRLGVVQIGLQLTSQGFSGWHNGDVICREIACDLTDVDDILLVCPDVSYFDDIRVMHKLEKSTEYNEEGGGTWSTVIANADGHCPDAEDSDLNSWTMVYYTDAKVDCDGLFSPDTVDDIIAIDIIMQIILEDNGITGANTWLCQLYVLNIGTYPGYYPDPPAPDEEDKEITIKFKFVTTNDTNTETIYIWDDDISDYSATPSSQIELRNLTRGPKSFKVDCYSSTYSGAAATDIYIHGVTVWNLDILDPTITVGDEEVHGFAFDVSLQSAGEKVFLIDYTVAGETRRVDQVLSIEYKGEFDAPMIAPTEFTENRDMNLSVPVEYTELLVQTLNLPLGYQAKPDLQITANVSWVNNTYIIETVPIEYAEFRGLSSLTSIEYLPSRSMVAVANVGYTKYLSTYEFINVEYAGDGSIIITTNVEYIFTLAEIDTSTAIEYTEFFDTTTTLPIGYTKLRVIESSANIEFISTIQAYNLSTPIEYTAFLETATVTLPIEYTVFFPAQLGIINIEYGGDGSIIQVISVEYIGEVENVSLTIPIEFIQTEVFSQTTSIGYMGEMGIIIIANVDYLGEILVYSGMLISYTKFRSNLSLVSNVEYGVLFSGAGIANIEYGSSRAIYSTTVIENKGYLFTSAITNIDYGRLRDITEILPVEYLVGYADSEFVNIEYGGTQTIAIVTTNIEYLYDWDTAQQICIGYTQYMKEVNVSISVAYTEFRNITEIIPIAYRSGAQPMASLLSIPIEWQYKPATISPKLPISWQYSPNLAIEIPIELLQGLPTASLAAPIGFTTLFAESALTAIGWTSAVGEIARLQIVIGWLAAHQKTLSIPMEYTLNVTSTEVVNVSYDLTLAQTFSCNIGYGYQIQQAITILTEWLGDKELSIDINIGYKGSIGPILTMEIEYQEGRTIVETVNISHLYEIASTLGVPIGWMGTIISVLLLTDVAIYIPSLSSQVLYDSKLEDVVLKCATAVDQTLKTASVDNVVLKIATVADTEVQGQN